MANYESKLNDFFKKLEKMEQEVKAKKHTSSSQPLEEPKPAAVEEAPRAPQIRQVEIESPVREAPASVVATVDPVGVVADTSYTDSVVPPAPVEVEPEPEPIITAEDKSATQLFENEEIPQVEDFLSFLNRSSETTGVPRPIQVEEIDDRFIDDPRDQRLLELGEGTGEPRPIIRPMPEPIVEPEQVVEHPQVEAQVQPEPEIRVEPPVQPRMEAQPQPQVQPEHRAEPVRPEPVRPEPQPPIEQELAPDGDMQANWDRMPHHLQTLFATPTNEVAQNSYKAFKETREELIQRLLDPIISLEEAARILNVCPTTVRRYTNRGVLQHYRTAGNQRRFKLSDVLVFMEGGSRRAKSASDEVPVEN